MEGEEFKDRQGSFEFFCAQAVEFLKCFVQECQTGWQAVFRKMAVLQAEQFNLDLIITKGASHEHCYI